MTGPAADMSRLERMIERLSTQRACLDRAVAMVADLSGPVLEVGLGKGRTYDHLRHTLPGREIFVFDRDIHAPESCVPDSPYLYLGDFAETLPMVRAQLAGSVALAHADIGSDNASADKPLAAEVCAALAPLMRSDAVVLGDREMSIEEWVPLALPAGAGRWPYFMYRVR